MQRLMKPLATKDHLKDMRKDIADARAGVGSANSKVDGVERNIGDFRDELDKLKKQVEERDVGTGSTQGRRSMGSASSSGHAEAAGARTWTPRIIHWRGWTPFGRDAAMRLTRSEAEDLQRRIGEQSPEELRDRLRWFQAFVWDHSASAEVLAPVAWEAKDFADRSNVELGRCPIEVKGHTIRAACETSADRRMAVNAYYIAKELAE